MPAGCSRPEQLVPISRKENVALIQADSSLIWLGSSPLFFRSERITADLNAAGKQPEVRLVTHQSNEW